LVSRSSADPNRGPFAGDYPQFVADAFLGTQRDIWDTQWDMFLALIGAVTAQLAFSGTHDKMLYAQIGYKPGED